MVEVNGNISRDGTSQSASSTDVYSKRGSNKNKICFAASPMKQVSTIMYRVVFTVLLLSAAKDHLIYGFRFVDTLKIKTEAQCLQKALPGSTGFCDSINEYLVFVPTVQHVSQRLLLIFCAIREDLEFFTRDTTQANVQSETSSQRLIYV